MAGKRLRRSRVLDVHVGFRLLPKVFIAAVLDDAAHLIHSDPPANGVEPGPIAADETFVDPNETALFTQAWAGGSLHGDLQGFKKIRPHVAELHHQKLVLARNIT